MSRMFGLILVGIGLLSLASPAHAQMTMADPYGMEDYGYGEYFHGYQTYGGIGLGSGQAVPAGGLIMDRFGMLHAIPSVVPAPTARAPRPRAAQARTGSSRAVAKSRYQLPTGSLYWPAASGVMLYSPFERYQSYGDGYGRGPYGSVDHGIMYKGWPVDNY
jgi:hypothetical protein